MTRTHATALLAAWVALGVVLASAGAIARQYYDDKTRNLFYIPELPPPALFGLWALDHKCAVRSARLRITATTVAFAGKPPVGYEYIPEAPHHLEGTVAPNGLHDDYIHDEIDRTLDLDTRDPERGQTYLPCFARRPGAQGNPGLAFERLMARLVHVPLSEAQSDALARVYFIKGEAAFRPLARLLAAGRRTELRARLQRFEQTMAVYPGLEHAGARGLAPPLPTPDFGPDRAGQ